MNINISRRKVIAGAGFATTAKWCTPIISGVILPAHAQMSVCQETDLVGAYNISTSNGDAFNFTLEEMGTGVDFMGLTELTWSFANNQITITMSTPSSNGSLLIFVATVEPPCSNFTGQINGTSETFMAEWIEL